MERSIPAETDTRQNIIEAAREIFARYGFRKATMDDIARAARKAKALFIITSRAKKRSSGKLLNKRRQRSKPKSPGRSPRLKPPRKNSAPMCSRG